MARLRWYAGILSETGVRSNTDTDTRKYLLYNVRHCGAVRIAGAWAEHLGREQCTYQANPMADGRRPAAMDKQQLF